MSRTHLIAAFTTAFALVATARAADLPVVHGQPSFVLENGSTQVAVTQVGGHLIAAFDRASAAPIRPYHVSPWQEEQAPGQSPIEPPILRVLRGDFFCMPFGANEEAVDGQQHPPHGETANGTWELVSQNGGDGVTSLTLALATKVRPGKVTKQLALVDGQPVIYGTHVIEGFAGKTPLAHHATLAMPETEKMLRVSTSPFRFGLTKPNQFSDPAKREYQSLAINARFSDLHHVPQIFKDAPDADCTSFPARRGFADLLCVVNEPSTKTGGPAWTAAVDNEKHFCWFALKDPAVLPITVFWIENHGRHAPPWSGRNSCLGLEDVCGNFSDGLAPSLRENELTKEGVPTTIELKADQPTSIRYIQGAVRVPESFDIVKSIEFSPGKAKLISAAGPAVEVNVQHEYLSDGKLR
jgi:hypothetical protein